MLELRCNIAPDEAYFYTKHVVRGGAGIREVERREERGFGALRRLRGDRVSAVSCLYKIGRHNNQDRF
jgi:hypothetical protein